MNLKKILIMLTLAFVICVAFASCKSRDACPGMSQTKIQQNKII
jgi:hypothetical protein